MSYARELVRSGASTAAINQWCIEGGHTNYARDKFNNAGAEHRRRLIRKEQALLAQEQAAKQAAIAKSKQKYSPSPTIGKLGETGSISLGFVYFAKLLCLTEDKS